MAPPESASSKDGKASKILDKEIWLSQENNTSSWLIWRWNGLLSLKLPAWGLTDEGSTAPAGSKATSLLWEAFLGWPHLTLLCLTGPWSPLAASDFFFLTSELYMHMVLEGPGLSPIWVDGGRVGSLVEHCLAGSSPRFCQSPALQDLKARSEKSEWEQPYTRLDSRPIW